MKITDTLQAKIMLLITEYDVHDSFDADAKAECAKQVADYFTHLIEEEAKRLDKESGDLAERVAPEEEPYFLSGYLRATGDLSSCLIEAAKGK